MSHAQLMMLSLASIFFNCLGPSLMYRHGDAKRKFTLSIIDVGLLDEEPENSPRRKAERNNLRWEKVGLGAVLLGIFLQAVSIFQ